MVLATENESRVPYSVMRVSVPLLCIESTRKVYREYLIV